MYWSLVWSICVLNILLAILIILIMIIMGGITTKYLIEYFCDGYDSLKMILNKVKDNNKDYMNFGYWDEDVETLTDANKNLCKKVINEFSDISGRVLDVGCGYGEQDIYWNKRYKYEITALDISEKQIQKAKKRLKKEKIKGVKFITGTSTSLPACDESYEKIICLESAFHYKPRVKFFSESYRVLKKNGEMVIADILVNKEKIGIVSTIFMKFYKKLLCIPEENLISVDEYIKELIDNGYIVEEKRITNKTFKPYFDHFFKNINVPNKLLSWIIYLIGKLTMNNMESFPFDYYIFKCVKK